MKCLSPVIAIVILLAVCVVIAVMVSDWAIEEVSEQTRNLPDCSVHTRYIIESAKFRSSTNETRVVVINKGGEGIYGFSLEIENGTHLEKVTGVTESPATSSSSKLGKGKSVFITYTCLGTPNRTLGLTATNIKVLNTGCPEVSAETETINQIT